MASVNVEEKPRYKARLVVKGFTKEGGVNYHEIFSPMFKHNSIIFLLSNITKLDLKFDQMNVKTSFLHGDLEVTIYMEKLEYFSSET